MVVYRNSVLALQRGLTLIEVLIAAVVLSIGLLGVFQLHIIAKKSSFESFQYSQVTAMATDIIERMRLNPDPARLPEYAGETYGEGNFGLPDVQCTVDNVGSPVSCNPTQIRAWDQYQWDQLLLGSSAKVGEQKIGAPSDLLGCIFVSGNEVSVVMSWRGLNKVSDSALANNSEAQSCGEESEYRRQVSISSNIADI